MVAALDDQIVMVVAAQSGPRQEREFSGGIYDLWHSSREQ
jgi:hypothetical protein